MILYCHYGYYGGMAFLESLLNALNNQWDCILWTVGPECLPAQSELWESFRPQFLGHLLPNYIESQPMHAYLTIHLAIIQ